MCLQRCLCVRPSSLPFDGVTLFHCGAHFPVGVGLLRTSSGPRVMTLYVLHIQAHPSLWNSDRTKGTPACANNVYVFVIVPLFLVDLCVVFVEDFPRSSVHAIALMLVYCRIFCIQCPAAAAPCRCGFNLYLSFSMLHSVHNSILEEGQLKSATKQHFILLKVTSRPKQNDTAKGNKSSSVMAVVGYLSFRVVPFLFDSLQICLTLICLIFSVIIYLFCWEMKVFFIMSSTNLSIPSSFKLEWFRDFNSAYIRR